MKKFRLDNLYSRTIWGVICVFVLFYSSVAQDQVPEDLGDVQTLSESGELVDPIEALFGNGYICLHIDDPKHATSPAFQAFALELAKKYNKTTKVHIGSNETEVHEHVKWTPPDDSSTTPPPEDGIPLTKTKKGRKPTVTDVINEGRKIQAANLRRSSCTKPGFFVHATNCNRYYQCVAPVGKETRFKLYNFVCGPGTIFDEKHSVCSHPWQVDPKPPCWKGDEATTTTEPPGQVPDGQLPDDYSDENQSPEITDLDGLSKGVKRPKPNTGEDFNFDVPKGGNKKDKPDESWIPELTTTKPPRKRKDKNKIRDQKKKIEDIITEGLTETHRRRPKPKPSKTNEPTSTPEPDDIEEDEVPVCTGPGSFGYENNCKKFYSCILGDGHYEMTDYDCDEEGEIFDEKSEGCLPAVQVNPKPKCWKKKPRKHRKGTTNTTSTTDIEMESTEDHKEDFDTIKTRERTSVFEQTSSEEEPESEEDPNRPKPNCIKEGTFSHPYNCSRFYKCEKEGNELEMKNFICQTGSIYDGKACRQTSKVKPRPSCAKYDSRFSDEDEYEDYEVEVNGVKIRKRRTKKKNDIEYEYETTEDEHGNKVRTKKPKNPLGDDEWETVVLKNGTTTRRKKKTTTKTSITLEGESYEVDGDDYDTPGNLTKRPTKKPKKIDDDDFEIIERNGKKIRRRKHKTTTTTTSWNTTEHTSSEEVDEDGVTKKPKRIPYVPDSDEYDYEETSDDYGHITTTKIKKKRTTTTTTETPRTPNEDDDDDEPPGLTKTHSSAPKRPLDSDEDSGYKGVRGKTTRKPKKPLDSEEDKGYKGVRGKTTRKPKKPLDSDSEEDAGYKGVRGKTTRKPKPPTDSDEDDSGWKGVRGSKTTTTESPGQEPDQTIDLDAPMPPDSPTPTEDSLTPTKTKRPRPAHTSEEKEECDDQSELIARLTKERDEALTSVIELTGTNAKLQKDIGKLNKTLESAIRSKLNLQEHLKKLDKTIESYKSEAEYLNNCCALKMEEDPGNPIFIKSKRRRRSVDFNDEGIIKSLSSSSTRKKKSPIPLAQTGDLNETIRMISKLKKKKPVTTVVAPNDNVEEIDDSHKYPSKQNNEKNEEEIEPEMTTMTMTSPSNLEQDTQSQREPPSTTISSMEMEPTITMTTTNQPDLITSSGSGSSSGNNSSSIFSKQLPLLIFIFLTLLLFSVIFLGCFIIKKLNRMTTFAISPDELETYYCKHHHGGRMSGSGGSGEMNESQISKKKSCTTKTTRHSDTYFAYSNE